MVVVPDDISFEDAADAINSFAEMMDIKAAIVQSDDGVLIDNRLNKPIPIVDEVSLIDKVPLGMSFEEGEEYKISRENEENVFPVIKPVVEKMASIIRNYIQGYDVDCIYVVGGACCFEKFSDVFEQYIGVRTVKPAAPLLVTPLGIAMNSRE